MKKTLKIFLNLKDNLKLIELPCGHQVVKTHVLISLGILKHNIQYLKNLCINNLKGHFKFVDNFKHNVKSS